MKNNSVYKEWITKAENDLTTAKILFSEHGPTDTLCFHCQQAVEKYLKAYLANKKIRFKKVHNLHTLAKLCVKADKRFSDFTNEYKILDAYYIESRYPPDTSVYSREEAQKALQMAEKLIRFVKQSLKEK